MESNNVWGSDRKESTLPFQNTDLNNFNSNLDLEVDGETDLNLSKMHRWRMLILFLSIMINFGSYYCYDLPNALSDLITDKLTHETENLILYNQLYSIISLPNVFLPFIGSFLMKRYGIHITMVSLNLWVLFGQIVFSISGYLVNENQNDYFPFYVALFGRFIYGLGGEILNVCQITILSNYFKNKELSFAIGMYFSCMWFAVWLWNYIVPLIASSSSLGFAFSSSSITWVISVLVTFVFIYIDNSISNSSDKIEVDEDSEDFNWKDVTELPKSFWLIMINCSFIFTGMLFNNISNGFFSTRYGFNQIEAAKFNANSGLVFIIMTPIFGFITDSIGHRVSLAIIN